MPLRGKPFPWDVVWNGRGFMLQQGDGRLGFKDTAPYDTHSESLGAEGVRWSDFSAGAGHRTIEAGTDEALRKGYYMTYAYADYGGADASEGILTLPPAAHLVTALGGPGAGKVRAILPRAFNGAYWLASGAQVIKSVNGEWTDAVATQGFNSRVLDIESFAGVNANPRLFVCQEFGPIFSSETGEAGTWDVDGAGASRIVTPGAFLVSKDGGATWDNATVYVSDSDPATAADLDGLSAANGQMLVGYARPWTDLLVQLKDSPNTNTASLALDYWTASGWAPLTLLVDQSSNGGKTFGFSGSGFREVVHARPLATWQRAVLGAQLGTSGVTPTALYWVRIRPTANFSGTVRLTGAQIAYNQEARALGVSGPYLWGALDGDLFWNEQGGSGGIWNYASRPIGVYTGTPMALAAASGSIFVKRDLDFGSVKSDGSSTNAAALVPELFNPPDDELYDVPMASWRNKIYFRHRETLFEYSPDTNVADIVGPERQPAAELGGVRITALCGERRALWAIGKGADGHSWLLKWGGYTWERDETGVWKWVRSQAWHYLMQLPSGKRFLRLETYTAASGQPLLVAGADDGSVTWWPLPRAQSNTDPYSGVTFSTVLGGIILGTLRNHASDRQLYLSAATVVGRRLSATSLVRLYSKLPDDATWGSPRADFSASNGDRQGFATRPLAYAHDLLLTLQTADTATTPIVDALTLETLAEAWRREELLVLKIIAADDVINHAGISFPWRRQQWEQYVDAAYNAGITTLIGEDGVTRTVVGRGKKVDPALDGDDRQRRVIGVTLAVLP